MNRRLRDEIAAVLDRAQGDGSKVVAIQAIRQVLAVDAARERAAGGPTA